MNTGYPPGYPPVSVTGGVQSPSIISYSTSSGSTHSYSLAEKKAFSNFINEVLRNDPDLTGVIPINPDNEDLFKVMSNGVLLCKLVNSIKQNTIDDRKIIKDPKVRIQMIQNHNLALAGAKSIGCQIVNLGAEDLVDGQAHNCLGVTWQAVKIGLLSKVNLDQHPELVAMLDPNEDIQRFINESPEHNLLRWFNYHLRRAGHHRLVNNFSEDIKDAENYLVLLEQIAPQLVPRGTSREPNPQRRAEFVCYYAQQLGCGSFITPKDILEGNDRLNLAFTADLFNKHSGLSVVAGDVAMEKALKAAEEALKMKYAEEERLRGIRWQQEEQERQKKWNDEEQLRQMQAAEQERLFREKEQQMMATLSAEQQKLREQQAREDEERRRRERETQDALRKLEEERRRLEAQLEQARIAEEERRRAFEAEMRLREARQREEEDKRREEEQRMMEEERRRQFEEQQRMKEEMERRKYEEEAARQKAWQDYYRQQEEAARAEEERRRAAAWADYNAKVAAEEEAKRQAAWADYNRKQAEAAALARAQAEAAARAQAEAAARAQAEAAARAQAEAAARAQAEAMARAQAEAAARAQAEAAARAQAEAAARAQAQAQAQAYAQQQAMLAAQQHAIYTTTVYQPPPPPVTTTTTTKTTTVVTQPQKPKWPIPRLVITVIRCRRLPKKDLVGKANPYVVLLHNGRRMKTDYQKSTLDPVFNTDLEFRNVMEHEEIHAQVWDKSTLKSDEFMGEIVLTAKDFQNGAEVWYQLQGREFRRDVVHGDLLLRFACIYA
eukprot:TRINITY_DN301_c0_g1_i1.p1 TRINITY_DN301_c0_g1~~TRINITY_DN301_c0_g1_i1.p1  ORF type:complete len:781 (-),score=266.22 TRINITY_DN301_c0_g1_i1:73-2415(-)